MATKKKQIEIDLVKSETVEDFYEAKAVEPAKEEVKVESKSNGKSFTTRNGTIRTDL